MKRIFYAAAAVFALSLLLMPADAISGRGGGGGPGGGGPGMGSGTGGMGGEERMMEQRQGGRGREMQMRQREQVRLCIDSADRLRKQAQEMRRFASGGRFNADEARGMQARLREQVQGMEQEHERLMDSFGESPPEGVRARFAKMAEARQRVRAQMEQVDGELARPDPDGKRIAEHAREMERSMEQWRKQYRDMENEMKD